MSINSNRVMAFMYSRTLAKCNVILSNCPSRQVLWRYSFVLPSETQLLFYHGFFITVRSSVYIWFGHGHRWAPFGHTCGGDCKQHHDEAVAPLSGIVNLRWRSCKVLRDATVTREVQLCMAVRREWRLHRWDKTRFMSVLRRCATSGNLRHW